MQKNQSFLLSHHETLKSSLVKSNLISVFLVIDEIVKSAVNFFLSRSCTHGKRF